MFIDFVCRRQFSDKSRGGLLAKKEGHKIADLAWPSLSAADGDERSTRHHECRDLSSVSPVSALKQASQPNSLTLFCKLAAFNVVRLLVQLAENRQKVKALDCVPGQSYGHFSILLSLTLHRFSLFLS